MAGHFQVFPLLGRKFRGQGQLGHTQDADHGRADFVGDVGQKMVFGPLAGLSRFPGGGELVLGGANGSQVAQQHPGQGQIGLGHGFPTQADQTVACWQAQFARGLAVQANPQGQAGELAGWEPEKRAGLGGGVDDDAVFIHEEPTVAGENSQGVGFADQAFEHGGGTP